MPAKQPKPEIDLSLCMLEDRAAIAHELKRGNGSPPKKTLLRYQSSKAKLSNRIKSHPKPSFDTKLPINQRIEEIKATIQQNQVIIICGETGSGKSTQIPKICLELGYGAAGLIGQTQPRRIAARSIASRLNQELPNKAYPVAGYKIRFNDTVSDHSRIKVLTDGMLLSEVEHHKALDQYEVIIIDEAHERSLNIDFLLGYLKRMLPQRPELKLIITSATIDPDSFANHFNSSPIIEVSGRTYPVEIIYRNEVELESKSQSQLIEQAIRDLIAIQTGDVLVFLPGEQDIRETQRHLNKCHIAHLEAIPLYARLSNDEQKRIFTDHTGIRVVLATNIAETSLTVPGIRYVVDCGTARISRFSIGRGVQHLPIEAISQASAKQRAGRCGRTANGICIRLYSKTDHDNRPKFVEAEILRTSLASLILRMESQHLGKLEDFPFIEFPTEGAIRSGQRLLVELGALNENQKITKLGQQLARFPLDPRLARIILAANELKCLATCLPIIAALASRDPRDTPEEFRTLANEKHKKWISKNSEFASFALIWRDWLPIRKLSQSKQRVWCKTNFLSWIRMREWSDTMIQLERTCKGLSLIILPDRSLENNELEQALLCGFLGNIAQLNEHGEYLGTRGKKLLLHPSSNLRTKPPKWIVAANLIDTSRLYARTVARIEPEWIERWSSHLTNKQYLDPHWSKSRGEVIAYEQVSLFGLVIVANRQLSYRRIAPQDCRELFLLDGLAAGQVEIKNHSRIERFYTHNIQLTAKLESEEQKTRRHDILVDDHIVAKFYDTKIPPHINCVATLNDWLKNASDGEKKALQMSEDDLRINDQDTNIDRFPEQIQIGENQLTLSYHFEPGHPNDGVTVSLPPSLLKQITEDPLSWLVPGLLIEKAIALIRSLAKPVRRLCAPAPDTANKALALLDSDKNNKVNFNAEFATAVSKVIGTDVTATDFNELALPAHLRMNIRVFDATGETLGSSRSLAELQSSLHIDSSTQIQQAIDRSIEQENILSWNFGDLPDEINSSIAGANIVLYPALVDKIDSVAIQLFDSIDHAHTNHHGGLHRLIRLSLAKQTKYLQQKLVGIDQTALLYASIGSKHELLEDILANTIDMSFKLPDYGLRRSVDFSERLHLGKQSMVSVAQKFCDQTGQYLKNYHTLRNQLAELNTKTSADIRNQLAYLVFPGFIQHTPESAFNRLPIYFRGIKIRIERASYAPDKDINKLNDIGLLMDAQEQGFETNWETPEQAQSFQQFRWLLEEYRLSIFAQEIRTAEKVSAKQLKNLVRSLHLL
jgi:ATP-dependent helicase HrpA